MPCPYVGVMGFNETSDRPENQQYHIDSSVCLSPFGLKSLIDLKKRNGHSTTDSVV
jgi:hypothetical protein